MKCVIHMLTATTVDGEYPDAVYVFGGYSVCDGAINGQDCLDAIGDDLHRTIMGARRMVDE